MVGVVINEREEVIKIWKLGVRKFVTGSFKVRLL